MRKTPKLRFKEFEGDWKEVKLSQIVERVTRKNKGNVSNLPLTISAQYGLVNQNIFFNKTIASKDLSNYYLLNKGEFAYNKSYSTGYPFGAIKRLDNYEEGVLSSLYICFAPNKNVISDYLVQYFETNKWHKEISMIAVEGARNHGLLNIAIGDFFETLHRLPEKKEQKKIAEFLSFMDEKISLQSEKVDFLNEYKRGIMQKIFNREIRFKNENGINYPKWEKKKIKEVGDVITGNTPSTKDKENYGDEYLWASPVDLGNKKFIKETMSKLSLKGFEKTRIISKGSILVTCIGSSIGKIGIAYTEMSTNQQINSLVCYKDYDNEFIYYALKQNFSKFLSYITFQAIPIINKSQFEEFEIEIPKIEEQKKIAVLISLLDEKIEREQEKMNLLNEYKKGLLYNMFV